MNHLREMLEQSSSGLLADSHISKRDSEQLMLDTRREAVKAQCFWLGDMSGLLDMQIIPELTRLPFETVWFEGDGQIIGVPEALIGLLICERNDESVELLCFSRYQRLWRLMWVVKPLNMEKGIFGFSSHDPGAGEMAKRCVLALRAFCSAMNCTNVGRKKHEVELKLQKARSKRGKAPLFSYWTLTLNGRGGETRDLGGTHAGTRVHLRRGHPRQFEIGKWTWVRAHAVGNKANGMVHKDYRAGPGLVAPTDYAPP